MRPRGGVRGCGGERGPGEGDRIRCYLFNGHRRQGRKGDQVRWKITNFTKRWIWLLQQQLFLLLLLFVVVAAVAASVIAAAAGIVAAVISVVVVANTVALVVSIVAAAL